MWLINTWSRQLEEFNGSQIPPYAILSHTWGDDEVSFQDMRNPTYSTWSDTTSKAGFVKILSTCELANQGRIPYAWIDTCCIDKSSSAELTEAINSMFKWYQRAAICYAWLSDLEIYADFDSDIDGSRNFDKCRWFTRGWTLQELIAPKEVEFYDRDWNSVGRKSGLIDQLHAVTAIAVDVLRGDEGALAHTCVAEKMSWAAGRETTRVEDATYCLMGIFGINMPLFYGEEDKAFQRLHKEILRESDDVTIFAWERALHRPPPHQSFRDGERILGGVLAESADDFAVHRHRTKIYPPPIKRPTLQVMKNCIKVYTELIWEEVPETGGRRYHVLCGYRGQESQEKVAIRLVKVAGGSFVRENLDQCVSSHNFHTDRLHRREFSMLVNVSSYPIRLFTQGSWDLVRIRFRCPKNMKVAEAWPWSKWHDEGHEFVAYPTRLCGSILFHVYHAVQPTDHPLSPEAGRRTDIVFTFDPHTVHPVTQGIKGALLERYGGFQSKVDHIKSVLNTEEPDCFGFDELLTQIGLPTSNKIVLNLGRPNRSAVLKFTSRRLTDPQDNATGWEVVFKIDEYETASVRPVKYQKWRADVWNSEGRTKGRTI
ncbi:heterokaryon incompatibility protein-domain-containing protein [Colletotrichum phormii]|uniref:Heterokaryon incompatibility protein-domain-containing protein n=1 Tax=Colletotrichum phormii TaxID=359342 RepID=A0AAJ0EP82_9PEZI|nr:heterokaryon incompatibility protein-domain-containing protein [Colletotrichum phormii]KAK1656344.1 heterokaryon incompatibility protein-domain-containing protein [Colletotrichum phormii]